MPYWKVTSKFIEILRDRSIVSHSQDIRMPDLDRAELQRHAMPHYQEMCRYCHGVPEYAPKEFASGLYPSPPEMTDGHVQEEWKSSQIYWIIKHGIKITGMPAFGPTHSDKEIWGLAAITEQVPRMTSDQYRQSLKAVTGNEERQAEGHHNSKADDTAGNDHEREMTPEEDTGHHH